MPRSAIRSPHTAELPCEAERCRSSGSLNPEASCVDWIHGLCVEGFVSFKSGVLDVQHGGWFRYWLPCRAQPVPAELSMENKRSY